MEEAQEFICREMGKEIGTRMSPEVLPVGLSAKEVLEFTKRFQALDGGRKGYIGINDLRRMMKNLGEKISDEQLHEMINEVDLNRNGQIELQEFLVLMSSIKSGHIVSSRLARAAEREYEKTMVSVERSGGGL
ncbi:GPD2 [Cordylochernes scorpioides]|uniref:GPD2 n=1 Tax=Cordylochernes scorpioides TaxID=51811 RepID=A0ABY6K1B8_9ARAC|nr:GPD2 [Cordylochernes scorpioides]